MNLLPPNSQQRLQFVGLHQSLSLVKVLDWNRELRFGGSGMMTSNSKLKFPFRFNPNPKSQRVAESSRSFCTTTYVLQMKHVREVEFGVHSTDGIATTNLTFQMYGGNWLNKTIIQSKICSHNSMQRLAVLIVCPKQNKQRHVAKGFS